MTLSKKILFGGLGWALGGPIGAIIGLFLASQETKEYSGSFHTSSNEYPRTKPGDFIVSLLVLFAAVMKADNKLLKSELNYVKKFLRQQFDDNQVREFMILLKDILKQDYPLRDICRQIQRSMDHPSRLELVHVLFGLSQADGHVDPNEVNVIHTIARYLNINDIDFDSIKAMFFKDTLSDFVILGIEPTASNDEIKKAYRKMATKYHPDKVVHLGDDFKKLAEEKFKSVNDAYHHIKEERGIS